MASPTIIRMRPQAQTRTQELSDRNSPTRNCASDVRVIDAPRNDAVSLRREFYFRRGGADLGVYLRFEPGEILLEHADQRPRGLVELGLVLPGLDRIEDMRLDPGKRGGHC